MHMYNNAYMYDISIECDFDRPTKKKKKRISITFDFILLGFVESKGPRRKKKKFNQRFEISKYVEQSKYTKVQRNV